MNHLLALIARADSDGLQVCLSNVGPLSKSITILSRFVLIPVFSTSSSLFQIVGGGGGTTYVLESSIIV